MMFQSLLSPIRSRLETLRPQIDVNNPSPGTSDLTSPQGTSLLSPRSPLAWGVTSPALSVFGTLPVAPSGSTDREDMANAEEFARDVLVELMRGLLEDMRTRVSGNGNGVNPDDVQAQIKFLSEICRIMRQDVTSLNSAPDSAGSINRDEPRTKAVFRELDGFLSLLSALSALSSSAYLDTEGATEQCIRLVFLVLTEALSSCMSNQVYFQTNVGWESLAQTLDALLNRSARGLHLLIFSHLLSLALEDFEAPFDNFFSFGEETALQVVDERVSAVSALKENVDRNLTIRHPSAIRLLWDVVHNDGQRQTCYALYRVLEALFRACHRNGCVLSSLAIVGDVFRRFQEVRLSLKTTNHHQDSDEENNFLEKEKHVLQRLLRRLLEMGANTTDARRIFQAAVIHEDGKEKLDAEILEVIRFGMKSRWMEHFSLEGKASIVISDEYKWKTLPKEGISLLMWLYPSTMPTGEAVQCLFSAESMISSPDVFTPPQSHLHFALWLLPDGRLKISSNATSVVEGVFATSPSKIRCSRWIHMALIWYPKMGGHPNLRLYLDGGFVEGMQLPYPRSDALPMGSTSSVQYKIGDDSAVNNSWCMASAYLLGLPLPSDIPRLIHHLGPRYTGSFQDPGIVRFLTYEAATLLNMYLATSSTPLLAPSPTRSPSSVPWFNAPSFTAAVTNKQGSSLLKALHEGLPSIGIRKEVLLFGVSPSSFHWGSGTNQSNSTSSFRSRRHSGSWANQDNNNTMGQKSLIIGDTFVVRAESLDDALWKCGGAAVSLRFVDLAENPHELSRALGILTDGLKNSWQNSEDMERMRGYDILGAILRRKAHFINLTSFETLFEFFGLNFTVPEQSTIVNPLAYKAIALDFSLWAKTGVASNASSSTASSTTLKIPLVHLDHFAMLLHRSRYRAFNWAVGLGEGLLSSRKKEKETDKAGSRGGRGSRSVSLVRKMLFALQMGWYAGVSKSQPSDEDHDMTQYLIDALGIVLRAPGGFGKDDVKAIVAYLAANLIEAEDARKASSPGMAVESSNESSLRVRQDGHADEATTPQSATSHFSFTVSSNNSTATSSRVNAEKVLELLVQILSENIPDATQHGNQSSLYNKFTSSLPINRILLLLLGERPTSHCAALILRLIGVGVARSSSFTRKFELVNGWNVVKIVLSSTSVWNSEVDRAAWDLLLGNTDAATSSGASTPTSAHSRKEKRRQNDKRPEVSCPQILPTILCALKTGLILVADRSTISDDDENGKNLSWITENVMERLVEKMLTLHASTETFRRVFESQQTTQLFIDAYDAMIERLTRVLANDSSVESVRPFVNGWNVRILEKLSHLGLALALDIVVGGSQKQEILDKIRSTEAILNPGAITTPIDPELLVDNRSVKQRLASARFSAIQVGERAVWKTMTRIVEWRMTVRTSEKKRLRKMMLDLREFRRQVSKLTEWTNLLTSERGLWPRNEECLWRLDETEGPHRIRKKLEDQTDNSPNSRVDSLGEITRDVQPPEAEPASFMHEVPPWAESYEISSTEVEEQQQLAEEIVDDKLRRVRHELEPGDVIEAVATVARVDGVDAYPGLLIFGRTHIYMLDGVVENDEGEVIDAQDAPKRLFFIPGSRIELSGSQKARRWPHSQMSSYSEKKFLFRDVALEIYFKDSRSLLIVFLDKKKRTDLENRLSLTVDRPQFDIGTAAGRPQSFVRIGSRLLTGFRLDELSTATKKWQARELSNFAYLSILNAISGRTPSDATQYPVFPWVLSDYTSETLDLNDPASYRDLTKPMGALTPARCQAAETRYTSLQGVGEDPFHYGTHFSSSMIVCHFLIRLAPFTHMFKTLQGGDWDLPDRLFSDLRRAYESAAIDVRGDVRELIPEFFTCPEFLENSANHDFGILQQTGERIHDVKLPAWARGDPLLFIVTNRRALESSIVSEQLPAWIDLIWGCKQRDPASLNVFHPLSYEGSIDLDSMKDDLERDATVGIIHNFGQTPRKLFSNPHPPRDKHGLHNLPVGVLHGIEEDPHLLAQNNRCFRDHGPNNAVRELVPDPTTGKVISCPEGMLCLPQYPHEHIEWRLGSTELRVVIDDKVVQVIENAFCTCATFADTTCLVTGSSDYTVRMWKVTRGQQAGITLPPSGGGTSGMHLALSHIMRVHTDEVTCVAASRPWSLVVSGSKDGSAAFWDLNRGVYVRSIWHGEGDSEMPVDLVAINDSTGYIATCSRLKLCLHTINARPIATLDLTTTSSFSPIVPTITAMTFHEREYSPLGVLATGGPDGSITLRTWTADGTPAGEKAKWEFLTITTVKVRPSGLGRPPAITALKFLGENLYHGEETGKCYTWNLTSN